MTKANRNHKQSLIAASIASMIGSTSYRANPDGKRKKSKTRSQQFILLISLFAFVGSTVFGMIRTYKEALEQPVQSQVETTEADSLQTELQAQIRGYELVLKREPNNSIVLEGLVSTYLQMNDYKGAIAPLEKLVKLNPGRSDYVKLLKQISSHNK